MESKVSFWYIVDASQSTVMNSMYAVMIHSIAIFT